MKELIQAIGLAKAKIDNGFSQVGRGLDAENPAHRAMMLLASRSIALGNSLIVLAQNDHANEALPVLRSLAGAAAEMRWIAQEQAEARARDFLKAHEKPQWETLWPTPILAARLKEFGFGPAVEAAVLEGCSEHLRANAQGLPWGHVFSEGAARGITPKRLLSAAAASLAHAVKALETVWPGKFDGAEQLWEKVKQHGE